MFRVGAAQSSPPGSALAGNSRDRLPAGILSTIKELLGDSASETRPLDDGAVVRAWVTKAEGSVVLTGQGRSADPHFAACLVWRQHPGLVDEATRAAPWSQAQGSLCPGHSQPPLGGRPERGLSRRGCR